MFGKKRQEARPKWDESEIGPVQQTLEALNRIQVEQFKRLREGERISSTSMVILNHRASELQKALIHEMDVIPVIDRKTGLWKLFQ